MYFRSRHNTDTSEIDKFNDSLNIEKYNILFKNVHKSWCAYLMEVKESKYDVSVTYDLSNYLKVPTMKRNNQSTSSNRSYHAQLSVLSALLNPVKLRIYNCSHCHHCESVAHSRSMIDIIILKIISLFYIVCLFIVELHHSLLKVDTTTQTQYYFVQWRKMITLLTIKKQKLFFLTNFVNWTNVRFVKIISMVW